MGRHNGHGRALLRGGNILASLIVGIALLTAASCKSTFDESLPSASFYRTDISPPSDPNLDTSTVDVGVQFSVGFSGWITAVQFYRPVASMLPYTVELWSPAGRLLVTQPYSSTKPGWQRVDLRFPVSVSAGQRYTASYVAPNGGYAHKANALLPEHPPTRDAITLHRGVYSYSLGSLPTLVWEDSSYYVDVQFKAQIGTRSTVDGASSNPGSPSTVLSAGRMASASPTRLSGPLTTLGPVVSPPFTTAALKLPRIPWEGGPAYWERFRNTANGPWTDPSFFPIVAWYDGVSSDAEVEYDKSIGINTYIGMDNSTPFSLFTRNGVYWIGSKLNGSFDPLSRNWVGNFLADEVDGRYSPSAGHAYLQRLANQYHGNGKFNYANFTQIVTGNYGPTNNLSSEKYVNNYTDVASTDMYWYTIPHCSEKPYADFTLIPVTESNCRTSSSYGKTMQSLRARDAKDGFLQPLWQFVENLNGGPGPSVPAVYITPAQLKGAVVNSIINEARGIVYFNQSFSGRCRSTNVIRDSEKSSGFCGDPQIAAISVVNAQIRQLAGVINTQSYKYTFGPGLNTMLKIQNQSAYVFSMIDGNSSAGSRTFHLPQGVRGKVVHVLNENRTLIVDANGRFKDKFSDESSYHIYRISI